MMRTARIIYAGYVIICLTSLSFGGMSDLAAADTPVVISSFTTSIEDQDSNVRSNIAMACEKIHGTVISPSGIFSFNETVGEGSAANGFLMGRVLYRDSVVMEPGGGLCQVSSTLFNAFLMAGLTVIERHRHFQPVTYVPLGLDATIKYGKKDLRIKNQYKQSVRISITANEKSLVVVILGEKAIPYRYEIFTEEETIPVPLTEESDRIRHGISVYVYRKRYSGNAFVDSSLLYKDYYPPVYVR